LFNALLLNKTWWELQLGFPAEAKFHFVQPLLLSFQELQTKLGSQVLEETQSN